MNSLITIPFHGDMLWAVERDGFQYVAIKSISERLGLSWGSQWNRLQRDPILSEGVFVMKMPSPTGGPQETTCLRLDLVNGWLFGIDDSRVREESRELVLMYKRECYRALFDHFYAKATAPHATVIDPGQPPEQIRDLQFALSIVRETRQSYGVKAAQQMWLKHTALPTVPAMFEPQAQPTLFEYAAANQQVTA